LSSIRLHISNHCDLTFLGLWKSYVYKLKIGKNCIKITRLQNLSNLTNFSSDPTPSQNTVLLSSSSLPNKTVFQKTILEIRYQTFVLHIAQTKKILCPTLIFLFKTEILDIVISRKKVVSSYLCKCIPIASQMLPNT
jgi:hypothetical protein